MTEWLVRIQTDTIVVQVLVEETEPYPQLYPTFGYPVWLGQNEVVQQRLGY